MTTDELDMKHDSVSTQLPVNIRAALVRASQIRNPMQRMAAIEAVQATAKARYPKLFK
jgi:hypothetical protein